MSSKRIEIFKKISNSPKKKKKKKKTHVILAVTRNLCEKFVCEICVSYEITQKFLGCKVETQTTITIKFSY
jgi:hypothetical protein